jgi:hypothetical protein
MVLNFAIDLGCFWGAFNMGIMRQVIEDSINVIEALPLANLRLAPPSVNARNIPNTITERAFSVTMQTDNTDKFRDKSPGGVMRYGHTLTVSLLCRLPPMDQMEGYNDAIDIEEKIILGMLVQADLPKYRTLYERSSRIIENSGEYVLIEIDFSIEQTASLF